MDNRFGRGRKNGIQGGQPYSYHIFLFFLVFIAFCGFEQLEFPIAKTVVVDIFWYILLPPR
jgi:hypothetical protein